MRYRWYSTQNKSTFVVRFSIFIIFHRLGFSVEICKFNMQPTWVPCISIADVSSIFLANMARQSMSFYQARAGKNHAKQILRDFWDHFSPSKTPFKQNLRLKWNKNKDSRCWHADFQAFQVGYILDRFWGGLYIWICNDWPRAPCLQRYVPKWATKKTTRTFHYAGCLIGILTRAYGVIPI